MWNLLHCSDGYNNCPLTASWKPLMLGVSAVNVTPGRRSIPSNTALLSDIYTATFSIVLQNLQHC